MKDARFEELLTAATTPDIAPRLVEGEPVCSGSECPYWYPQINGSIAPDNCEHGPTGRLCIPALRAQRDALQAEQDAARRELCAVVAMEAPELYPTQRDVAASRDWSYLYEVKP